MSQTPPPHGSYSSQQQHPQQPQQYNPYQQQNPYGGQPPKKKKGPLFWILTILGSLLGLLFLLFILLLIIGGLVSNSHDEASDPMESVSPIATETAGNNGDTNERGNIEAKIGDEMQVTGRNDGKSVYKFKVTNIEPNFQCTGSYPQPSEHGKFVKIDMEVNTGTKEAIENNYYTKVYMSGSSFKYIAKNGTTYNGSLGTGPSYGCLPDSERFPMELGPAQKASGSIVVDVPTTDGTLLFEDSQSSGGIEYKIP